MWVWLRLKLIPKGDHTEWANIVTFHPKHPKWDQNLQFAPLSERKNIPITFIRESPPLWAVGSLLMQLFINTYQLNSFSLIEERENWNTLFLQNRCFSLIFLKPIRSVCEDFNSYMYFVHEHRLQENHYFLVFPPALYIHVWINFNWAMTGSLRCSCLGFSW